MGDPLFISQDKLEGWLAEGDVTFGDNVLAFPKEGRSYHLDPAVRITLLLDGTDVAGLVGQVCPHAELVARGAEIYRSSIILGDAAYECEEGYLGTPEPVIATSSEATPASTTEQPSDMDLLTDFLLKNL